MKITTDTKIAELIEANALVVEALASMAKPFHILRNTVLRKVMAPRTSIAEAARIGKCSLSEMEAALSKLGFQCVGFEAPLSEKESAEPKPEWLTAANPAAIKNFDVRAMIAGGNDPLQAILKRYNDLKPGEILCVVNSFAPTPLLQVLAKKGAQSFISREREDVFHTWFSAPAETVYAPHKKATEAQTLRMHDLDSFQELLRSFDLWDLLEIDVRALPMPEPMHSILAALDDLKGKKALYVQHKKVPVFLLEELADKNFSVHVYEVAEGDVKLLIYPR